MSTTHDHAVRGRFHSWFLSATETAMHRIYGERKQVLFGALPDHIVEVGPGTGLNLRYYPAGTEVVAVEPNLRMHERLAESAKQRQIELDIRGLKGEAVDLPDECTDLVVCTLVLCSADDPAQVLHEIRRLLRPGGRYIFIEHVAAPAGTALRRFQNLVQPPWAWWFEGCCPNRETWTAIEAAGFRSVEMEHFKVHSPFVHTVPQIAGVAVK